MKPRNTQRRLPSSKPAERTLRAALDHLAKGADNPLSFPIQAAR